MPLYTVSRVSSDGFLFHMTDSEFADVINWRALWKELDWEDESRHDEVIQQRLRQRARQYASALPERQQDVSDIRNMLSFQLGDEQYAVDVMLVRTVRPVSKITPVPGTPAYYRGVVNIRGQIITVIDLRLFFDMDVDLRETPDEMIVVQASSLELGVLAHRVRDVVAIPAGIVESLDDVRYAFGITEDHIILLDIERMFEDERLIVGGVDE